MDDETERYVRALLYGVLGAGVGLAGARYGSRLQTIDKIKNAAGKASEREMFSYGKNPTTREWQSRGPQEVAERYARRYPESSNLESASRAYGLGGAGGALGYWQPEVGEELNKMQTTPDYLNDALQRMRNGLAPKN